MSNPSLDLRDLEPNQTHVRILETTDLHLHVMPYDYFTDKPQPATGLAQAASAIAELRRTSGLCLLLDNGDFLQGTPVSDWVAEDSGFGPGDLHPMVGAMNALGYDGGTLGNHDFNYGLDFLRNALAGADFPLVSANITTRQGSTPDQDTTLQPPWTILERQVTTGNGQQHSLRIGLIGFAPPQTRNWESFSDGPTFDTRDIVAAARAHVPHLRAAGADIVIALAHTGIDAAAHTEGMENAAVPLAAVDGIDAVLAGHTHQLFPDAAAPARAPAVVDPVAGTLHGKPAVMAGCHGSHIGVIDLLLDRHGDGWRITGHQARLQAVRKTQASDPAVAASIKPAHDTVTGLLRQHIGHTDAALHSHLSLVGHSTALRVLADALGDYARIKLAGGSHADWPMAVAVAPSRSGGQGGPDNYVDIPQGPLALRHAAELYHYPNKLCVLAVTGRQIRDWLEWSARLFQRLEPGGQDQPLLNSCVPGYNFDTLYGLRYQIDPSKPAATGPASGDGARIGRLTLADGRPLQAEDRVLLATNTYRASGGGGFAPATPDQVIYSGERSLREVVQRYMHGASLSPDAAAVWRFAALPGTTAWFESGPDALRHLPATATTRIAAGTVHPGGFRRYLISL